MTLIELPPSSKNDDSGPAGATPRTPSTHSATARSRSFIGRAGLRSCGAGSPGGGSLAVSSLLLGVSGKASSTRVVAGTM